jgi:hypothetical protein
VCPSDQVLNKLRQAHPEFVNKLEEKGVKYTAYMASVQDASKVTYIDPCIESSLLALEIQSTVPCLLAYRLMVP